MRLNMGVSYYKGGWKANNDTVFNIGTLNGAAAFVADVLALVAEAAALVAEPDAFVADVAAEDALVVADAAAVVAVVIRPAESTVTIGIAVCEPYVPAVRPAMVLREAFRTTDAEPSNA